jgi:sigma-B regulation protein RsbU (phosphoserine phosphatase)
LIVIAIIVFLILIMLFLTIFLANRLSNSVTAPITKLTSDAHFIGEGNLDKRLEVKTGDEIEELAHTFNGMIDSIKTISAEKQRISSELSVASGIQNDMLPKIFPSFTGNDYFNIFAKMTPAKEVGGDFYDFFFIDEDETKIGCVIADVSGKGVPAALFMVIAKTLVKQQMQYTRDLSEVLKAVNLSLCGDSNPHSMFCTMFIMTIDLCTGEMLYANGGHNAPLLSVNNDPYQFMELKKSPPPGMFDMSKYKLCTLTLNPGDKLVLYTDGVNEAMNTAGEQFSNERFIETANHLRDLNPQDFDTKLREALSAFTIDAEQSDDITTLVFYFNKKKEGGSGKL